ncbi:MAG: substrate-binding domain-containing protein [Planctomycetes bacterium]|nr:substrate-binding domain-containing protein [Planctomycetota bacterium]
MKPPIRELLVLGGGMAAGAVLSTWVSPERRAGRKSAASAGGAASGEEEYVWLSANANLSLFTGRDHPALYKVGAELGVRVTIAGPNTVDIPGLVAAIEQTTARRPSGMMVVGWDANALIPAINKAVESGVPVVCVDADVPASKRLAFIGTDWFDLGVRQGEAMVKALQGRRGEVALLGLIEQAIDQQAFTGFRSVVEKAGLTALEPQQDKGNQAEAARVASAILQARPGLVGMAGFDSESGPGMGLALRESGRAGKVVATCVETAEQHLRLLKDGVLTACIGQKRELFTYYGVKSLHDYVHSTLKLTADDRRAGVTPVPVNYSTGTFTVTRENVDLYLTRGN